MEYWNLKKKITILFFFVFERTINLKKQITTYNFFVFELKNYKYKYEQAMNMGPGKFKI